ncbi:hypothetical protein F0562_024340 [Nyssa sinensis]|uniref:Protein-L-isoaspartate O-methyltransferase n=1 Tax=Nyssa sinensis TaxID=561372 RepID=A0A5J5BI01_9ASTE|nr:hypothetical protein F0562_024340 [Nyssa sinensis]
MQMPSSVIAYGCRYLAPLKPRLINFTLRRYRPHRRRLLLPPLATVAVTLSSCRLPKPNFCAGNSLFLGMEVDFLSRSLLSLYVCMYTYAHVSIDRFWAGSGINTNKAMVEHLQHYGVMKSKKVVEVMETVDRALFVPSGTPPYVDSPMQIGYNATISAPHMHATCLQLLEENLQHGMHALDVGSGTGLFDSMLCTYGWTTGSGGWCRTYS